jgi:hypothetical protein
VAGMRVMLLSNRGFRENRLMEDLRIMLLSNLEFGENWLMEVLHILLLSNPEFVNIGSSKICV